MAKYKVECSSKPDIFFDELPENIYWGHGFQRIEDKNKGFYFHFDDGTCLVPIIEIETGKQITKPN